MQAGVNPKIVSEQLGHHSVAFTLDTYAHVLPGMQAAAARDFSDLVFGIVIDEPVRADEQYASGDTRGQVGPDCEDGDDELGTGAGGMKPATL